MIDASRFIVQSRYRDYWLAARRNGITATAVAKAATPSGFRAEVESWTAAPFEGNEFTDFGTESERHILEHAHREFGILPSDWLVAADDNPTYMGTPDGISLDHTLIAEAKTGGTVPKSVSREHRDQCLWNLRVTGAERCLYLFQLRVRDGDGFRFGLWEPTVFWVPRDEARIRELELVAEQLLEARHGELQPS